MYSRRKLGPLTAVMLAAGLMLIGCDSDVRRADRQVEQELNKGIDLAQEGTENSIRQAQQVLESAASNKDASLATRTNIKSLLAQTELENARTAQRKVDRCQIELARLVWETNQLGQQIGTTNAFVAGYRKYDPKAALSNIEKSIADATGGPEKPAWFTHDNTTLPTLSAVRQSIATFEAEITKHQDRISDLSAQRDKALADAEAQSRRAREGRRGENIDAFNRASDLRKQASDLGSAIEAEQSALVPLQRDLAISQAQQAVLEEVITQLQAQAASLESGWKMVREQITAQANLANQILQSQENASSAAAARAAIGGSIATKAAEIARLVDELKSLREQAMDDARNAATHYEEAARAADDLRKQLGAKIAEYRDRPEAKAWTQLINSLSPPIFMLQQSAAQRALASLHASRAAEYDLRIMLRNSLAPVLEAAALPTPETLQAPNLERDRELALKEASDAYAEANRLLDNVVEGQRDESLANSAQVARILTLYGWSQLERQANNEKSSEEHLQLAMQYRNAALEQSMPLPPLPSALGAPPVPPPAESPATTPADDATAPPDSSDAPATTPADSATQPG